MRIFLALITMILTGALTAYIAQKQGREPFRWFLIGAFLGIFGPFLALMFPPEEPDVKSIEDYPAMTLNPPEEQILPLNYQQKEWYYLDAERQQKGPTNFANILKLWSEGLISPETYLWCEGMKDWKTAADLKIF